MKLPSADEAEVPRAKIVLYLLNPNHRSGKSKARFFLHHGFTVEQWMQLAEALRSHAHENKISKRERTPLGERVVIEGPIGFPMAKLHRFAQYGLLKLEREYRGWRRPIRCDRKDNMINELDDVILTRDMPEHGLSAGDIGTVVLVHRNGAGYEVEFTALDGETIAVLTLMPDEVRRANSHEIAHARQLATV